VGSLMLLDTASLYYRAFYGMPETVTAPDGTPVNAIRGLLDAIGRLVRDRAPSRLVACLDADWRPAFRVAAVPSYKAHRAEPDGTEQTPPGLAVQIPLITQVLEAAGIAIAEHAGYEADDVIATLARRAADRASGPVEVVTGDRDLFQLVDDARGISVLYTIKGLGKLDPVTETEITKKYDIPGRAYGDFAVLRGDPSDGLPGVPGIGEKTAAALIRAFGDVAGIARALDAGHGGFPPGARKKLEAARGYLDIAPAVVQTATDVPLPEVDGTLPASPPDPEALAEIGAALGLGSSLTRFRAAVTAQLSPTEQEKPQMTAAPDLYPPERLRQVAEATRAAGLGALLLTPGPDLRYVTGYDAKQLERLTCLVVPADGDPFLVVPRLELKAAQASPAGGLGAEIVTWGETDDPFGMVRDRIRGVESLGLSDRMWALNVLRFAGTFPGVKQILASSVLSELRVRKSAAEVAALREAGAAIDRVHAKVPGWLRPGVTEREAGAKIAEAILAEGHASVDFTIVGSGPNAASPHHEVSDRVLLAGDVVVVDIGGTMPSGYTSDCTRTYAISTPPAEFTEYYEVLRRAQDAGCHAARPGVTAESVDKAARDIIDAAGYGQWFIHRTGHGIGLETHEDPYIVAGNRTPLEPGMAFSVEPGIYPGPHGARIEDIVVCTSDGCERLNNATRELVIV
jgi:Xaa-Pro aminopeptidase/5'-3' exonuclease